ncbi:hypothetical protein RhiirA5_357123 [Rhizophagus irregularis]|uniref:Uncharacterized protein n=3 Tax=Rhizophagus irregularis TaxID=588596 RepID=A0A2I1DTQ0_9GLOM|nr:hypothetical protein GLOIN_2v1470996 [Rhizophagus irregularis DAOM 181602=DAOM 197198]EXX63668.1 hypothetical protein RirG_150210 [Rhizophagus irregularis DAOM 197198w]PKC09099.1 hypothetical protein RhiirA5_357123 [Rhizophagus irregularis]PKC75068.1 hypothetical protein RhiirA1_141120 [Rhizophagus irregularis]PKY13262.1 hypothetical protein RhiirB3_398582 [Rhizophagus irregularis]POG81031.1 hypothetical protein GLOIN_2v1470996 [Rhizophagus irregularis DAOM 181602=DAOM 197198]|eukprot:XP_025187897.1 hypothetical protein GLOIN_2v1470996 [Rhizophagus irregularis DAOM 181602=DAOM 197198]
MNVSCRCYNCNTNIPTNTYVSSNNSDKQNLVLQICKGIFEAIQNENTTADISCSMSHKQIRNTNEVEECINKEFGQLFRNNVLRKEISSYSIFNTWRIRFKWSEFNNDSLIKNLLKISKEWYNPFTNYLQRIDSQMSNKRFYEQNGKDDILDNLKNLLPGFDYLIEYSWNSYYNNYCYGDFVFASYSGIFIKVTVNTKDGHRFQSLKNKNKSLENFEGKYVTLLRATYNHDEDDSENATLEFIDDSDEIIVQNLKKIHTTSLQRYDNNRNREEEIVDQIATVAAGAVVGIAAVAAVAGVGFLAYKAATNKTVRRAATAVSYGQLAYSLIKEFEEFEEKNERERNNDDD